MSSIRQTEGWMSSIRARFVARFVASIRLIAFALKDISVQTFLRDFRAINPILSRFSKHRHDCDQLV